MSPEKLAKVLAGILKDFEPWPEPSKAYSWGGPCVELSKEQMQSLLPFSIFLALVTFARFPYYGKSEKIAWSIPILFKGAPYLISHEKFGLKIHPAEPEVRDIERERLLVDRLLHAVRIADGMAKPFAEQQIRAGKVTIANNSFLFRGKYEFFRSRAEECYQTAQPVTGEDQVARINRKFRYDREAFFFASATLDSYFSYLEHLLVLLLPFSDFDPAKDNLVEFINSFWAEKFKRIFDLSSDPEAERVYHSLLQVKERFRNPLTHGGFDKDGTTLLFHVPGLGAVPAALSKFHRSINYGFNPIVEASFGEVCATLDAADTFMAAGPKRLAFRCCAESPVQISFDAASLTRFRNATKSDASMDEFIEGMLTAMDNAANMDW
jgi:hypothetical protein